MPDLELRKLWKLHLVDKQLQDIRHRAAALDPGRKLQAETASLTAEFEVKAAHLKTLNGEVTDLELQQKSIDDKIKKIDRDLYSGKVVNPREVEGFQKEIEILKRQRGDSDEKLLGLWDAIPPVKAEADAASARVQEKKQQLAEYQKKVLATKSQLESEFTERATRRPELAKEVSPALLSRYEVLRKKLDGVAMAGISRKGTCEACGTNLPTKTIELAKEGSTITCESCHRLLYFSEGLI